MHVQTAPVGLERRTLPFGKLPNRKNNTTEDCAACIYTILEDQKIVRHVFTLFLRNSIHDKGASDLHVQPDTFWNDALFLKNQRLGPGDGTSLTILHRFTEMMKWLKSRWKDIKV
jgi:hypothetical protein